MNNCAYEEVTPEAAQLMLDRRLQKLALRKQERRRLYLGIGLLLGLSYLLFYGFGGTLGLQWWLVLAIATSIWCMLDRRQSFVRETVDKKRLARRDKRLALEAIARKKIVEATE